jgi:transposase
VKRERELFVEDMKHLDPNKLIFIDESYSRCGITLDYGRGENGKRVEDHKPYRGEKLTLIGALGLNKMRTMMTIDCSTTTEVFTEFTKHFLVPVLKPGDIVILDNLGSHKDNKIQSMIENVGAKVKFLPPYSPDLNPIEQCWSKIKQFIKRARPTTRELLEKALLAALEAVSIENIRGWYECSGYVA